jgi:hypothetical protein
MELEPSFVQTINGKPMQFYRMGGKRTNPNSMEHLVPYMVPTTYAVLCLLLLQLGRKNWPYYAADLATSFTCAALHHFKQPLLSINLAIGYTIWNLIPGSLAAKDLPSHSEFMQNLKIKEPADSPMECAICWEDDQSTAELPCGHKFCLPCIKLMTAGEKFQTTCPTCRKPLFNIAERLQIAGRKGNHTTFALNFLRAVLHLVYEFKMQHYYMAAFNLALVISMLAVPACVMYMVWSHGFLRDWLTNKPSAKSWNDLYTTGFVFVSSAAMVCTNLWSDYLRFG